MKPTVAIALILIVAIPCSLAKKGIGVSGPDQIFSLSPGMDKRSYIRIYNTGDVLTTYILSITGNASQMIFPGSNEISLDPGQNGKILLNYSIPSGQELGFYSAKFLVSIKGQQISPSVSKQIEINVSESKRNENPRVKFLSPNSAEVSGRVEISIEVIDMNEEELEVSLFIDDVLISNETEYIWNTLNWEDGKHLITAKAVDGKSQVNAILTVYVRNELPRASIWLTVMLLSFTVALIVSHAYAGRVGSDHGGRKK